MCVMKKVMLARIAPKLFVIYVKKKVTKQQIVPNLSLPVCLFTITTTRTHVVQFRSLVIFRLFLRHHVIISIPIVTYTNHVIHILNVILIITVTNTIVITTTTIIVIPTAEKILHMILIDLILLVCHQEDGEYVKAE